MICIENYYVLLNKQQPSIVFELIRIINIKIMGNTLDSRTKVSKLLDSLPHIYEYRAVVAVLTIPKENLQRTTFYLLQIATFCNPN